MQSQGIIENRDIQSIAYILNESNMFFTTGYKVLKTQERNGFVACRRVLHNGKDKLIYDISKYKSLSSLLSSLNPNAFKLILGSLADVISEVRNNGFMQCENVLTSAENIFVDCNSYKVYLIYLPVNTNSNPNSFLIFESRIKQNIINCIRSYANICDIEIQTVCEQLSSSNLSAESVLRSAGTANKRQESDPVELKVQVIPSEPVVTKPQKIKKEKIKKEKKIFGRKREKNHSSDLPKFTNEDEGGATEVLEDLFVKNIAFCGIQTPAKIEFVINKPEFSIGKKADMVDGAVTFNNAISRIHCKIITEKGKYFIVDLGSANGTFVNSERIAQNAKVEINPGDKIKLANSNFLIKSV